MMKILATASILAVIGALFFLGMCEPNLHWLWSHSLGEVIAATILALCLKLIVAILLLLTMPLLEWVWTRKYIPFWKREMPNWHY